MRRIVVVAVVVACSGCASAASPGPSSVGSPVVTGTSAAAPPVASQATTPIPSPSIAHRFVVGDPTFGPDGSIYTTDCSAGVVLRLTGSETAVVVAGQVEPPIVGGSSQAGAGTFGDGGPATEASLLCPTGVAFDFAGRLLIVDHGQNRIRRIEADGTIGTIVGVKSPPLVNQGSFTGDGGPASDATLNAPTRLMIDARGSMYISDRENDRVRVVTPDGIIRTLAGDGDETFGGDGGPAASASLDYPLQTVEDARGNVYIADDNHNRVRKVTPNGMISTVIGDGAFASGGDGGPASKARVNDPQGVALDDAGNLYVSEYGGNRVRRIDPKGIVTTIAGTGNAGTAGIGGPAIDADVAAPGSLVIGPDGAMYTNDQEHHLDLRTDLGTGIVTTVAGGPDGVLVP